MMSEARSEIIEQEAWMGVLVDGSFGMFEGQPAVLARFSDPLLLVYDQDESRFVEHDDLSKYTEIVGDVELTCFNYDNGETWRVEVQFALEER